MKLRKINHAATIMMALVVMMHALNQPVYAIQTGTADDSGEVDSPETFSQLFQRVNNLFQTLDQNGLNPVVKQQFMLEVARAFFNTSGDAPPPELRHEVANLTTDADFEKWLAAKWMESDLASVAGKNSSSIRDEISNSVLQQIDPVARFVTAKNNRVNKQLAENQYVGIGISVRWVDDKAMIADPFPGGAARKAGARPNDFIMTVDGQSMEGLDLGKIVDVLRGLEGTRVSIVLQNKDGSKPRSLDMVRSVVPIPSIHGVVRNDDGSWQFMGDDGPTFAYMNVSQIVGSSSAELKEAAQKVIAKGATGVILDLRNVTDGDLHQANMIADVLCGKADFGTLETPNGQLRMLISREHSDFAELPMAVLSPPASVSGPILALLALLKKRPQTTVIGAPIQSNLNCLSSFDLPDNDGAIANLAYAKIVPLLTGNLPGNRSAQDHNISRLNLVVHFEPTQLEAEPADAIKAAKAWLKQHSKNPDS